MHPLSHLAWCGNACLCKCTKILTAGSCTSAQMHENSVMHLLNLFGNTTNLLCYFYHKKEGWRTQLCHKFLPLTFWIEITGQLVCKDLLSPVNCFLFSVQVTTCSARQGITRKITMEKHCAATLCFLFRCTLLFWYVLVPDLCNYVCCPCLARGK